MREIKDSLIRAMFNKPEKALELYSDISGKTYPPGTKVEMATPDDIILYKQRCDIAFIIDGILIVIMEHQSTLSKNIPLRMLQYVLIIFSMYLDLGASLYKEKRVMIPKPEFYMLYNGNAPCPYKSEMRLSDSFIGKKVDEEPTLELVVNVININYDTKSEIITKNKDLREYALFIEKIRNKQENGMELKKALKETVKECLAEGILLELLKEHEGEVDSMFSMIYDEELARKYAWEEGREEGKIEGKIEGREEGKIELYFTELGLSIKQIAEKMNLGEEDVNAALNRLGLA